MKCINCKYFLSCTKASEDLKECKEFKFKRKIIKEIKKKQREKDEYYQRYF